ncbi:methyltransferase [Pontibacter locisalis]|uniref:Methyltransferase n=1 Tax=Pontibacter locisalis TaxID=1719035 RepID=A0ABW5IPE2_9BACT
MKKTDFPGEYKKTHKERYQKTLNFMEGLVTPSEKILDLGPVNPLSSILKEKGFEVENTPEHLDLDLDYRQIDSAGFGAVTAFEIIEHLVSPFPLLRSLKAPKLIASIPLKLWFADAYWNENDPYDRHYHEFEPRQFDMLLNKAGWEIKKSEKWVSKTSKIGIRPFLRNITPRHYIVYCERVPGFKYD